WSGVRSSRGTRDLGRRGVSGERLIDYHLDRHTQLRREPDGSFNFGFFRRGPIVGSGASGTRIAGEIEPGTIGVFVLLPTSEGIGQVDGAAGIQSGPRAHPYGP